MPMINSHVSKLCDLDSNSSPSALDFINRCIISIVSTNTEFKAIALRDGQTSFLLNIFIVDESNQDNPIQLQLWNDQALKYKCRILKGSMLLVTHFRLVLSRENRRVIRDATIKIVDESKDYEHGCIINMFDQTNLLAFKRKFLSSSYLEHATIPNHFQSMDTACFQSSLGYYRVNIPVVIQSDDIQKLMNVDYCADIGVDDDAVVIRNTDNAAFMIPICDVEGNSSKLMLFNNHLEIIQNELTKNLVTDDSNKTDNKTGLKVTTKRNITLLAKDITVEHIYRKTITCFKATVQSSFSVWNREVDNNANLSSNCKSISTQLLSSLVTDIVEEDTTAVKSAIDDINVATKNILKISWDNYINFLRYYEVPVSTSATVLDTSHHHNNINNHNNIYELRCRLIEVIFDHEDNNNVNEFQPSIAAATDNHDCNSAPIDIHNTKTDRVRNRDISVCSDLITITKNEQFTQLPHRYSASTINTVNDNGNNNNKRARIDTTDNDNIHNVNSVDHLDGYNEESIADVIVRYRPIKFILGAPTITAISTEKTIVTHGDINHNRTTNVTSPTTVITTNVMNSTTVPVISGAVTSNKVVSTLEFYNTQATSTAPVQNTFKDDVGILALIPPTNAHKNFNNNSYCSQWSNTSYFTGTGQSNSSSSTAGVANVQFAAVAGDECMTKLFSNIPADIFALSCLDNLKQKEQQPQRQQTNENNLSSNHNTTSSSEPFINLLKLHNTNQQHQQSQQQQQSIHYDHNDQIITILTNPNTNTSNTHHLQQQRPQQRLFDYESAVLNFCSAFKQSAMHSDEFTFRLAVLPLADENGMLLSENVIFLDSIVLE